MNTLLLIGGDLGMRTAALLDHDHWEVIGLRRRPMRYNSYDDILWYQANLWDWRSLSFLGRDEFSEVTHILYAPAPAGRTHRDYAEIYSFGLGRVLYSLPRNFRDRLQRCVLVGSSAVWGPSDEWVNEDTPVQRIGFRAESLLDAETALGALLAPGIGTTLRLSGLYGPDRMRLIDGLVNDTITAPEGPGHWANRLHIDDAARACAHLLTLADPDPLYIGTDDHPMPTADLYDAVAELAGTDRPTRQPRPPSGKRLSNARLRAGGWTPEWPDALAGYAACLAESGR
ncbi:MAG: hypothetical protein L0H54_07215 [Alcaligenaceae bacterium]|nr:hypothetical protein [Alcaligenaceae bacterium]